MSNKVIGLAVTAIAFSTPAFAEKLRMSVRPTNEAQVGRMDRGHQVLDSHGQAADIRITPSVDEIKKRGSFQLIVFNGGQTAFDIGPENIRGTTSTGESVKILGYEQLARELRGKMRWAAVGAALMAMGNNINAAQQGYGSDIVNYRSTTYGSFGSTNFSANTTGSGFYSYHDPVAQQMALDRADRQNAAMFQNLQAAGSTARGKLDENLRTTTIDPGRSTGGVIVFELPDSAARSKTPVIVTFAIGTGGDEHVISATFTGKKMAVPVQPSTSRQIARNQDPRPIASIPAQVGYQPAPAAQYIPSGSPEVDPSARMAANPIMQAYQQDLKNTGTKSKAVLIER